MQRCCPNLVESCRSISLYVEYWRNEIAVAVAVADESLIMWRLAIVLRAIVPTSHQFVRFIGMACLIFWLWCSHTAG